MPFTVSHIAGILPFTSKRLSLPFAALTALCLLAAIARGRIAERKPEGEMDDPAAT